MDFLKEIKTKNGIPEDFRFTFSMGCISKDHI